VGYLLVLFIPLTLLINTVFNALLLRRPLDIPQKFNGSVDVLIPLRNEEANLIGLLESLRSQVGIERIHFYLLDDNSTDNTVDLVKGYIAMDRGFPIHLVKLSRNRGKGGAIKTGVEFARGKYILMVTTS